MNAKQLLGVVKSASLRVSDMLEKEAGGAVSAGKKIVSLTKLVKAGKASPAQVKRLEGLRHLLQSEGKLVAFEKGGINALRGTQGAGAEAAAVRVAEEAAVRDAASKTARKAMGEAKEVGRVATTGREARRADAAIADLSVGARHSNIQTHRGSKLYKNPGRGHEHVRPAKRNDYVKSQALNQNTGKLLGVDAAPLTQHADGYSRGGFAIANVQAGLPAHLAPMRIKNVPGTSNSVYVRSSQARPLRVMDRRAAAAANPPKPTPPLPKPQAPKPPGTTPTPGSTPNPSSTPTPKPPGAKTKPLGTTPTPPGTTPKPPGAKTKPLGTTPTPPGTTPTPPGTGSWKKPAAIAGAGAVGGMMLGSRWNQ